MSKLIVYHVHPGQRFSRANAAMANVASALDEITFVDLYAEYPRYDIDVEKEQARLLQHDVVLFQFPFYWYSTPSLLKEWQDLVLQHGFAYGHDGDKLAGKTLMLAITAGGSDDAYTPNGYQHYPIRKFLTPLEQTARLCRMTFSPPYVLYAALKADAAQQIEHHTNGYARLLAAILDDTYDFHSAEAYDVVTSNEIQKLARA